MTNIILIQGGGDLASGIAYRLHKAGLKVLISELPQPLSVRRKVSFCEAIYDGEITIEGITGRLIRPEEISDTLKKEKIPVLIDPDLDILQIPIPNSKISVLIDATLRKHARVGLVDVPLNIGLGPGFTAPENCHAVIETNRGHSLGRIYWEGSAMADTGIPEQVLGIRSERVLRAPANGKLVAHGDIGDHFDKDEIICEVDGIPLYAPFNGSLRGLIRPGLSVKKGLKIGDLDPRDDPRYSTMISDKALALGGSVLEAILSQKEIRDGLWS
ncbi:MAG: EF2563 family selenium-dependent molybdenum hydroxylase system protein [Anaerolineae bacterium]|jgi:xanthine dehydrogenase accessory factor|nr:EF2563 family selenium-dependent molybdenum hydroxylase system protein [Anaerolineae bacterium]MBT7075428.1 EF2563 family selenium-dependent molybdenum hydroxylase system protein [Anaerolineae bacterium]MBT7782927.1 EF2563 family selenium-dependent molybdenum hydroxylase system protein [Anaerolineae bacterium]